MRTGSPSGLQANRSWSEERRTVPVELPYRLVGARRTTRTRTPGGLGGHGVSEGRREVTVEAPCHPQPGRRRAHPPLGARYCHLTEVSSRRLGVRMAHVAATAPAGSG